MGQAPDTLSDTQLIWQAASSGDVPGIARIGNDAHPTLVERSVVFLKGLLYSRRAATCSGRGTVSWGMASHIPGRSMTYPRSTPSSGGSPHQESVSSFMTLFLCPKCAGGEQPRH